MAMAMAAPSTSQCWRATPDASILAKALEQMTERAANVDTAYDYLLQASMIKAVWAMETELRAIDAYPFG